MAYNLVLKTTDRHGNQAFITVGDGWVRCCLCDRTPAALVYAGVPHHLQEEAAIMFGRAANSSDLLITAERYIVAPTTFEVF